MSKSLDAQWNGSDIIDINWNGATVSVGDLKFFSAGGGWSGLNKQRFMVPFYVQIIPTYNSWNDDINGAKAVAVTQKCPKDPKGLVLRFEVTFPYERLVPTVKLDLEQEEIKATVVGLGGNPVE